MPTDIHLHVDVTTADGAAVVNILKPGSSKTFATYAKDIFLPHLQKRLEQTTSRKKIK